MRELMILINDEIFGNALLKLLTLYSYIVRGEICKRKGTLCVICC